MNKRTLNEPKHVALIGMMGSGKTTVGQLLARKLGKRFQDCDAILSAQTNLSIEQLFASEGEPGFRKREQELLTTILKSSHPSVIATGGGVILSEDSCKLLKKHSDCVFLQAPVKVLVSRIKAQHAPAQRPLIKNTDIASRIPQLLSKREPLYDGTAHCSVVLTNEQTPQQTVDVLIPRYQPQSQQSSPVPRQ